MEIPYINRLYEYLKSFCAEGEQVWDYDSVDGVHFEDMTVYIGHEKYVFVPDKGDYCLKIVTDPNESPYLEPFIYQKAKEQGLEQYFCKTGADAFEVSIPEMGACLGYMQEMANYGARDVVEKFEDVAPKELLDFLNTYGLHDFHTDNWFWTKDGQVKLLDYSS